MHILLVDDAKKHREAGNDDLTSQGHRVLTLNNYSAIPEIVGNNHFDCALLDLLMPAEEMKLGKDGMAYFAKPLAVGYFLASYIAMCGIPLIAVATDAGHHDHPASALMDWFSDKPFRINNSRVLYMHSPMKLSGRNVLVKDWIEVLRRLNT